MASRMVARGFHMLLAVICLWIISCDVAQAADSSCRAFHKAKRPSSYPPIDDVGKFCRGSLVSLPCPLRTNYTDTSSCQSYYQCEGDVINSCDCESGLFYSPAQRKCVSPSEYIHENTATACTCAGAPQPTSTTAKPTTPVLSTASTVVKITVGSGGSPKLQTRTTTMGAPVGADMEVAVIAVMVVIAVILPVVLVVLVVMCYRGQLHCQLSKNADDYKPPSPSLEGKDRHEYAEVNDKMVRGERHWFSEIPPPIPVSQPPSVSTLGQPSVTGSTSYLMRHQQVPTAPHHAAAYLPHHHQQQHVEHSSASSQQCSQCRATPHSLISPQSRFPFSPVHTCASAEMITMGGAGRRVSGHFPSFQRANPAPRMGMTAYTGPFSPSSSVSAMTVNHQSPVSVNGEESSCTHSQDGSCSSHETSVDSRDIGLGVGSTHHAAVPSVRPPIIRPMVVKLGPTHGVGYPSNYMSKALDV